MRSDQELTDTQRKRGQQTRARETELNAGLVATSILSRHATGARSVTTGFHGKTVAVDPR